MPPKAAAKPAAKPAKAEPKAATAAKPSGKAAPAPATGKKQVVPAPAAKAAAPATAAAPTSKKDTAGVYIKGIGAGLDLEAIKKVFKAAGNIIAARRRGDKYAIVWFDSQGAAKKAIETFHNKPIQGNKVTVAAAKAAPPRDRAEYCKTLFLNNVNPSQTRLQIREALKGYGEIVKIRQRGTFAFVYFNDVKSAVKARNEVNGKKFFGRFVEAKLSIRTKERDDKREKSARKLTRFFATYRKWVLRK